MRFWNAPLNTYTYWFVYFFPPAGGNLSAIAQFYVDFKLDSLEGSSVIGTNDGFIAYGDADAVRISVSRNKRFWVHWEESQVNTHDDVIKWKHFPRYWPLVRGIHRSPVNPLHKGEWRGALMFSLICVWINRWVNSCEAGDLRRHRYHYDIIVMPQRTHDAKITSLLHQYVVLA